MANLLAVKAHPLTSEASKSVKVFEEFLDAYKTSNPDDQITIVDLYDEDFPEIDKDIMAAWGALQAGAAFEDLTAEQARKVARFNESTEQFLNADKVVVANGLWNLSIPTRLKAWFDTVNVAGKTFKYTAEGPVGLAGGKKVLHIQASGGVYGGEEPASHYINTIFNFIGIDDVQNVLIEGADYDPSRTEEIVGAAMDKAREIAQEF